MPEAMHAGHDGQARLTADIRNPTSKLMLTILAGVAIWEREVMLERQREGIAKAKSEGKYKGRPASIDAAEIKRLTATMGPAAIAKHLGIARSTVYRLLEPAKVA
jgi:DNA invertase Pin-like site-specific DNA recombinase